jgi:hypothetical protein
VDVEPGGQRLGHRGILAGIDGDGRAPLDAVRDDGRAPRADGPGEQAEQPGEPFLGGAVGGEDVEGAREQDLLLVRVPVLGPPVVDAAIREGRWGRDGGSPGGHPVGALVDHRIHRRPRGRPADIPRPPTR